MGFSQHLIKWYATAHRPLPWRKTKDPYKIWLSEIILQQTRIDQGTDYYHRFIDKFPDIFSLAAAQEVEVLKLWQGLGYYSRARNLHATAKMIAHEHNGIFPDDYDTVKGLKGIGPYTAAAVLSIAFNKPYALVDGNVFRVMTRFLAIETPVTDAQTRKTVMAFLDSEIDKKQPGIFNQSLMELGALICKPQNPACNECPLAKDCAALKLGLTSSLPVQGKKIRVTKRYFNYIVITSYTGKKRYIYINKRSKTDIWKNLYDFPLIETAKSKSAGRIIKSQEWEEMFSGTHAEVISVSEPVMHQLTHQTLIVRFIEVAIPSKLKSSNDFIRIKTDDILNYPVPRLIEKYLEKLPE
jgi:A/G-specific adenine glycosylase